MDELIELYADLIVAADVDKHIVAALEDAGARLSSSYWTGRADGYADAARRLKIALRKRGVDVEQNLDGGSDG